MRKYFKNLFGFPVEREPDLVGERCRDPSRSRDVVKKKPSIGESFFQHFSERLCMASMPIDSRSRRARDTTE